VNIPGTGPAGGRNASDGDEIARMPSVEVVRELSTDVYRWLLRPRVRLTVTGVTLLLCGAVFFTSSVWTLPLVIAGLLMVAIAWVGSRLEGHFTVEIGADGTQFHCGARIKPHAAVLPAPAASPQAVPDADVVEGTAHTVEIEVAELEALIAAAGQVSRSP
jgi:hypothetical protein